MRIEETKLKGCYLLEPKTFEDARGIFFEGFNQKWFKDYPSFQFEIKQMNCSVSSKGVLRGLHFQKPPFEQAKLVYVTKGVVLDIAVDLRPDSDTFKQYVSVELTAENKKRIFIPKGFAHGFVTLSEEAHLNYLVDQYYEPKSDSGLIYDDPDLAIDWKISEHDLELILSNKDKNLQTFKDYINE